LPTARALEPRRRSAVKDLQDRSFPREGFVKPRCPGARDFDCDEPPIGMQALPAVGATLFTILVLIWLTSSLWFFRKVGIEL
jgi:hypothetical protein